MLQFLKNLNKHRLILRNARKYRNFCDAKRAIEDALIVSKQHEKIFPKFKNINRGKSIGIVATGSSLESFCPDAISEDVLYLGVNRSVQYKKIEYSYFFIQDYSGSKGYISEISDYKRPSKQDCIKFYGRVVENRKGLDSIIPDLEIERANALMYYTGYPDRRFVYNIDNVGLPDFGSVVFSAFMFALWTHPKRIYLIGCDCSDVYFDKMRSKSNFSDLINSWKMAKKFQKAYYPDVEIVSVNPVGLKGLFLDYYQN